MQRSSRVDTKIFSKTSQLNEVFNNDYSLIHGDALNFLSNIDHKNPFDLIITSPPYNIGKEYEKKVALEKYLQEQEKIITLLVEKLSPHGSLCYQVGNYVDQGSIVPLDIEFHPIFSKLGMKLRNRIVWKFGHGLHCKNRFSGRYEVVMWYTKSDTYTFNLDEVRVPSKYPGKKHFKGPNAGKLSGNPLGKNPEDVWDIPNVKSNHIEKADHPCQFPVGLVQRLVLALSNPGDTVFDPFSGVGSTGVACAATNRKFIGCDIDKYYLTQAQTRINDTLAGKVNFRDHAKPIFDHNESSLGPQSLMRN